MLCSVETVTPDHTADTKWALGGGWGVPADRPASLQWLSREALALRKGTGQLAPWGRTVSRRGRATPRAGLWALVHRRALARPPVVKKPWKLIKVQWKGKKKNPSLVQGQVEKPRAKENVQRTFLVSLGWAAVAPGLPVGAWQCRGLPETQLVWKIDTRVGAQRAGLRGFTLEGGRRLVMRHVTAEASSSQTAPDGVPGLACGGPGPCCMGAVLY